VQDRACVNCDHADVEISRTTVYRQLEKLVEAGLVTKNLFDGSAVAMFSVNQKTQDEYYYHLLCEVCGSFNRLKCKSLQPIAKHIEEEHHFHINDTKTVFYGKCKDCLAL